MSAEYLPKIVVASDLFYGDIVYQTRSGGWSQDVRDAKRFDNPLAAERALKTAENQSQQVVRAKLADAIPAENRDSLSHHI